MNLSRVQARMRRRTFASAAAGAVAACISARSGAAAQFQYKLGHNVLSSHPIGVGATEFAEAVRRESGGRIDISIFPNSTLGSDPSMISQCRSGALEMTAQGPAPLEAVTPVAAIAFVGFAFTRSAQAIAAYDGAVGEIVRQELSAKRLVAFQKTWETGFRHMTTSAHPIRTVEDLNGLKMRVPPSGITVDMYKTLGASPVPLTVNELYTALQTHLVDGCDGSFVNIMSSKLYEVQRYLSVTNHQWSSEWLLMNADAWNALPPDLQTIVERNANRAAVRATRSAEAQNAAVGDQLVRLGMRMNVPDPAVFRQRLGGYYQHWKGELGTRAWSALEQYCGRLG